MSDEELSSLSETNVECQRLGNSTALAPHANSADALFVSFLNINKTLDCESESTDIVLISIVDKILGVWDISLQNILKDCISVPNFSKTSACTYSLSIYLFSHAYMIEILM